MSIVKVKIHLKKIFLWFFPVQIQPNSLIILILQNFINQIFIFSLVFLKEITKEINISEKFALIYYFILSAIRITALVIFLLVRKQIFLCGNRLCVAMLIIVVRQHNYIMRSIDLALVLVETISIITLVLIHNKTFRDNPIMGRLLLRPYFLKEICLPLLYLTVYLSTDNRIYFILLLIGLRVLFTFQDVLYNLRYKKFLIYLQVGNLFLFLLQLRYENQSNLLVHLAVFSAFLYLGIKRDNYAYKLTMMQNIKTQKKDNIIKDQDLFQQLILLNYLLYENRTENLIQFAQNHKKLCKDVNCPILYTKSIFKQDKEFQSGQQQLKKLLNLYFRKQMNRYTQMNSTVTQLIIFLILPAVSAFKYMIKENLFHYRLLQQKNNFNEIISTSDIQYTEIKKINSNLQNNLYSFMKCYSHFFQVICRQDLDYQEIRTILDELLDKENEIRSYKKINQLLTTKNQYMLNKIFSYIMKEQQLLPQITEKQRKINHYNELGIVLLASAQQMDMGKILSFNKQAIKWLGYTITQLQKMSIDDLVHQSIRNTHKETLKDHKYNKLSEQNMTMEFPSILFLTNKNGYLITFKLTIHRFSSIQGRKWLLKIEPILNNKLILVIDVNEKVLGISQNCVGFGIDKSIIGEEISAYLKNAKVCSSRINTMRQNQCIFNNIKKIIPIQKVNNRVSNFTIAQIELQQSQQLSIKQNKNQKIVPFTFIRKAKRVLGFITQFREQKIYHTLNMTMNVMENDETDNTWNNQILQQIEQLILFQGKIDHKKNVRLNQFSHQDFPIKFINKQITPNKQISQQTFKKKLFENQFGSWLLCAIVVILVIIAILAIVIYIACFTILTINNNSMEIKLKSFLLLNRQMEYYTYVGMQPLMNKLQINSTSIENNYIQLVKKIHENWQQLQLLDPNIMTLLKERSFSFQGSNSETFKQLLQKNNLFLEKYHQKPTAELEQKILQYLDIINYGFLSITDQVSIVYLQKLQQIFTILEILYISFVILIILFLCNIYLFLYQVYRLNNKILYILKQLQPKQLQKYINNVQKIIIQAKIPIQDSIQSFNENSLNQLFLKQSIKKTTVFRNKVNKNIAKYQEQECYINKNKRNIKKNADNYFNYMTIILIAISFFICFKTIFQILQENKQAISSEIKFELTTNLYKIGPIYIMIEKSILDQKKNEINQYLNKAMDVTQQVDYFYQKGIEQQSYTEQFILYYDEFWNGKTCNLNSVDCYEQLSGSLKQGVSTMITYLNLQYWKIGKIKTLKIQQMQARMAELIIARNKYLRFFMDNFLKEIERENKKHKGQWKQQSIQYFVTFLLISLVYFGLGFGEVFLQLKSVKKTKQILRKIPFQQLTNIDKFSQYFI